MILLKNNKPLVLSLLLLVFILPMILSIIFYHFYYSFHVKTNNHGILIRPPISVSNLLHVDTHQWQIVFASDDCENEAADRTLFYLHQLHIAFGENHHRVSLTLMTNPLCKRNQLYDFRKITLPPVQMSRLKNALHFHDSVMNKIYLIDPLDNLFMYYPVSTDPIHIFSDMKKILGVSRIG